LGDLIEGRHCLDAANQTVPRLATVLLRHRPCHFVCFFSINFFPWLRQNKKKQKQTVVIIAKQ